MVFLDYTCFGFSSVQYSISCFWEHSIEKLSMALILIFVFLTPRRSEINPLAEGTSTCIDNEGGKTGRTYRMADV